MKDSTAIGFGCHLRIPGFDAPGLHVGNIPEDEDLLNVALWEERASKQWCGLVKTATWVMGSVAEHGVVGENGEDWFG